MRNTVKKRSQRKAVTIERRNLGNTEELKLLTESCPGCGLCADACPLHALTFLPAVISNWQLLRKARIDMDPAKCLFCGACAAICPQNALELVKNGQPRIPLQDSGTMPRILKSIKVQADKCCITCDLICQEACPTGAIDVKTSTSADGSKKIQDVEIEPKLCNFCSRCEEACPFDSITVEKPITGTAELESDECKQDCRICADLCPTGAIKRVDSEKMELEVRFCTFCKTCEKACPEKAIHVQISHLNTSGERSGVWFNILERMASTEKLSSELYKISGRKRRKSAADRLL